MKKFISWVVIGVCLLSLFGCFRKNPFGKNDPFILDGPGMIYVPVWTSFTLTQTSDSGRIDFTFTVTDDYAEPTVQGICRDETGVVYESQEGIPISFQTIADLRELKLEGLEDVDETPTEPATNSSSSQGNTITLTFISDNGFPYDKIADPQLATKIYSILFPYFQTLESTN